ncbi:hypothetical protein D3C87_1257040 [compost metagenome]
MRAGFVDGGLHGPEQRRGHHHGPRAAVVEHIGVVIHGQQRVHRHRHHAGQQAAEEHGREIDGIERAQQHALLAPEARLAQRAGKAAAARVEFGKGGRAGIVDIGHLGATAGGEVARQQVIGRVVTGGQRGDNGLGAGGRGRHVSTPLAAPAMVRRVRRDRLQRWSCSGYLVTGSLCRRCRCILFHIDYYASEGMHYITVCSTRRPALCRTYNAALAGLIPNFLPCVATPNRH